MRISRKAEYALRALFIIAQDPPGKIHQIQELSERGHIPVKFLEQILLALRNHGILSSKRGVGGGYTMRKRASELTMLQVIELLDGEIAPLPCALDKWADRCGCPDPLRCPLRPVIKQTREMIRELFGSKSIQDLLDESLERPVMAFEI